MRTVFVLMDSLNRRAMECYGGKWAKTPNFTRFSERAVTFDNHYTGSLPCMPARRELHTGRLNFLHRSWGPMEPYDDSATEILKRRDVYSHMITDHYHYFEDGGWSYHTRYSSWENMRGQEWDPWKGLVDWPLDEWRETYHHFAHGETDRAKRWRHIANRQFIREEEDFPAVQCFKHGLEFLERNKKADDWMLQIETFSPHEPFIAPQRFRDMYPTDYQGPILDWPRYKRVEETPEQIAEIRANYAAMMTMCDEYFGQILDFFDANDMWKDTALVLTTDHGFMLSEHDWWGKNRMPYYDEVAHIPLMVYHPDHADKGGERRSSLTQTIDLMPTLLDFHGETDVPSDVEGRSIRPVLESDQPIRDAALYGMFGGPIDITDGRYTYFRYPVDVENQEINEYTLMPAHQGSLFKIHEFEGAELTTEFKFSKGAPILKLPGHKDAERPPVQGGGIADCVNVLYDLQTDPGQTTPLDDPEVEARLIARMVEMMAENEAPPEAYRRYGLPSPE
jgi:arylsulfatase A-like enzyme